MEKKVGDDVANYVARTDAHRGTKVHHMCEDFLNNNFDEETHKKNFLPYVLFGQIKPVLSEKSRITYLHKNVDCIQINIRVAGRVDCIAEYNGVPSIIDFKLQQKNEMMIGMSPTIFKHLHMQKCLKNELELKSIRL